MELKKVLGKNVVKHRILAEITQQELAADAQISVSHLRNIEHGRSNATIDMIERISKSLNVLPEELFRK
jgi:transcriptional regulator with XRE-family HTH domain